MSPSPARTSLEHDGRALVERLGGRWAAGKGGLCRCPAHDDRRPSLSVRPGRRSLLLHCFAGCDTRRVLEALRARGMTLAASHDATGTAVQPGGAARSRAQARRIWRAAKPLAGTPAERYLARRGLRRPDDELRYHPRTPHGPWPFTQYRPALIAAVRDADGIAAIHRTFLGPDGRGLAAIDEPRMGLGGFGSGAVRLGGVAPRLGLAEGLETALAAAALFGIPCWATLGAERFGRVALPDEVRTLVLFLDADGGERRAERLARAAYSHLPIEARYPRRRGADWNDVLRAAPPGG